MTRTHVPVTIILALFVTLLLFSPLSAYATPIPSVALTFSDGTDSVTLWPTGVANGDGSFTYADASASSPLPSLQLDEYNLKVDPDPEVDAFFSVKNTTAFTKTYTVNSTTPISPVITPTALTTGSVGGSVTDVNGNTATLTSVTGVPIYQSLIDGANWASLLNDPQSFSAASHKTTIFGGVSFGDLISTVLYPNPINSSIGITLTFTLSSGDSAAFTSVFAVDQGPTIPEPSTVALLGTGLIGLLGYSRVRRRSRAKSPG